ncbi:MAG: tRNA lysidine(34) synthetase TilS [bacterium (Candidatus Ratteibacteria) CG_4_9_14_3_um_filter_41_21]|uniref:tRNA(Ile)-lysidine synthase n=2 Tax=Candidatus Ratteibacteria TaxID=2979319 RepID=A0A2M7YI05_9BACT|nr:MAG: tRNA lysidine(34) synthetase TilS [bacterium (Candidatus Ratteibacteria) CG01_land_8_20_14_3_00_40_19]PJA62596.1 MAG: tRNA lysidine(34) synthetase TilS [bacterium (Candidatus Ratteibacteria) CG_4_9_14_3_um_filter_41_21]HCG77408.1 tRNA lysidine(34) synthetase TilS [bacterium]
MDLLGKVKQTIKKYSLIGVGDKVLLGISGGPDSVALLDLLFRFKKKLKFSLFLCHLNHGLRKEAENEAHFVKELANSFFLPITIKRKNISKVKGGSLEEKARNARYRFFTQTAKKYHAHKIAIAHNLDDQAETILLRIIRGTGLLGLGGIRFKRPLENASSIQIIRPLLSVNREKILNYLKERELSFVKDKSNDSPIYLRNRIRAQLLPVLAEYNPRIKESLAKLAIACQEDFDGIEKTASAFLSKIVKRGKREIEFDVKEFLKTPGYLQKEILRLALKYLSAKPLSFSAIESLQFLISQEKGKSSLSLPGGLVARRFHKNLIIQRLYK